MKAKCVFDLTSKEHMPIFMWSLDYYSANFWLLLCTHALASFLLNIHIAKKLYEELKVIKCFWKFAVAKIQPKFKKFCQIYVHGSNKYPQILKDIFKKPLSYLVCSQINH
jgi:hypothetical protein